MDFPVAVLVVGRILLVGSVYAFGDRLTARLTRDPGRAEDLRDWLFAIAFTLVLATVPSDVVRHSDAPWAWPVAIAVLVPTVAALAWALWRAGRVIAPDTRDWQLREYLRRALPALALAPVLLFAAVAYDELRPRPFTIVVTGLVADDAYRTHVSALFNDFARSSGDVRFHAVLDEALDSDQARAVQRERRADIVVFGRFDPASFCSRLDILDRDELVRYDRAGCPQLAVGDMLSFAEVVFQSTLGHRVRVDLARAHWSRALRDLEEWERSAAQIVTEPARAFHERALAAGFAALMVSAPAAALERALPAEPAARAHAWLLAGRGEYGTLQFASAEDRFRAAIAADPEHAEAHLWAGRAAIRQGAGCRAAADFGRARSLGANLADQEAAIVDAKSCAGRG